jgi:dynein assembly factor 1
MSVEMEPKLLKKLCKENGLYTTPSINDKLYLHYKGFPRIQNLEAYTGLKALWLEGNGLTKIEGLTGQTELRSLFLHENVFEKVEGMEALTKLDTLNLSKNFISHVENLAHMKELSTLNLAHNKLVELSGLEHLVEIPSLQTVDLQHNKIEGAGIVDILEKLPDLRVVYLMGNPCVKAIRNYRRTIVSRCPQLRYLDDRPVFEEERRRTNAWAAAFKETDGDLDAANAAERAMLNTIREEKKAVEESNYRAFEQLMREGQEIKKARDAARAATAGKGEEGENVDANRINPYTGSEILDVPESASLTKEREARWAKVRAGETLRPNEAPLPPADSEVEAMAAAGEAGLPVLPAPPSDSASASTLPPPAPSVAVDLDELD